MVIIIIIIINLRQIKSKKHNINKKFNESRPHYSVVLTNTQKNTMIFLTSTLNAVLRQEILLQENEAGSPIFRWYVRSICNFDDGWKFDNNGGGRGITQITP
jgi:hypothetical protein